MATAHAKNRPPSAAKRWLPCPFSATVAPLYNRDETDASLKGDEWHKLMEVMMEFGAVPVECDPDAAEAMQDLYAFVLKVFKAAGPGARLYVEQRVDIPETGEFGTVDIGIVSPTLIAVIDHKSGYIPVEVRLNAQMLVYLLGLIAQYGERPKYLLAIHQPNYDHIDGPIREWEPDNDSIAAFRASVIDSVNNPDRILAGHHCKETYCEHRGACVAFNEYARNDLSLGWHTSELKGMSDADLAKALDASDELAGYRTELRTEAMRRIMNMDRKVHGYKVVKGRRNRQVRDARALTYAVREAMGDEWAAKLFPDLSFLTTDQILLGATRDETLKMLGTAKHIEDVLKQYARVHNLPRGGWKQLYDNVVGEYIAETAGGLTLERAIDGRPAHTRGSEFGVIDPAKSNTLPIIL